MEATIDMAVDEIAEEAIHVDVSHLVTEDDTPVDNLYSEKQMRVLAHPLHVVDWNRGRPFVVMANVGLYFALNAPVLVPDVLVSLGVSLPIDLKPKEHRAYFQWLYGKPPDVVIEVVSNKIGGELDRKMRGYAAHNVPFYVVYDPGHLIQEVNLQCFELERKGTNSAYRKKADANFPDLGLGLVEWKGTFENQEDTWLRWIDSEGNLIPTGEERANAEAQRADVEAQRADMEAQRAAVEAQRADMEAQRANSEAQRADMEAQNAKRESERAEALAAKFRELGIDPAAFNKS